MKRTVCVLLALALCLPLLAACGEPGSTRGVQLAPGASERFSEAEIRSAMDCAMARFRKEFGGCILTRLAYSEAYQESYLAGSGAVGDGNTIVLLADYVETETNTPHTSRPWVLTRADAAAAWKVQSSK
ncbi:MAG: hypothetical protein ACI3XD_10350 [Oscillospiraceae bacterium]